MAGGQPAITAAVQALGGIDVEVDDIGLRRPTLDEVFLTLTGAPAQPGDEGQREGAGQVSAV